MGNFIAPSRILINQTQQMHQVFFYLLISARLWERASIAALNISVRVLLAVGVPYARRAAAAPARDPMVAAKILASLFSRFSQQLRAFLTAVKVASSVSSPLAGAGRGSQGFGSCVFSFRPRCLAIW
jgi:hypothetical protein